MKISAFIVIRRYLCIFLLGVLVKKKSKRNLPSAFAVNLVKIKNRSLEFINKNGSRTHPSQKHFPRQIHSKASD